MPMPMPTVFTQSLSYSVTTLESVTRRTIESRLNHKHHLSLSTVLMSVFLSLILIT